MYRWYHKFAVHIFLSICSNKVNGLCFAFLVLLTAQNTLHYKPHEAIYRNIQLFILFISGTLSITPGSVVATDQNRPSN